VRVGITPRQFQDLQERAIGKRRIPMPASASGMARPSATLPRVILGVDPSLRSTGYGIIRAGRPEPLLLAQGAVRCPASWERSRCLVRIAEVLRDMIRAHRPEVCIVEGLFYAQNYQTALILGEARGAVLVAAAEAGLAIFEMAPRKVKQAIAGYGAAHKAPVARMVQRMLGVVQPLGADAADALALALAYAQSMGSYRLQPLQRV